MSGRELAPKVTPTVAMAKLQERIPLGEEIARRAVATEDEYRAAKEAFDDWHSGNNVLLQALFDTDEVAKGYRPSAPPIPFRRPWRAHVAAGRSRV